MTAYPVCFIQSLEPELECPHLLFHPVVDLQVNCPCSISSQIRVMTAQQM